MGHGLLVCPALIAQCLGAVDAHEDPPARVEGLLTSVEDYIRVEHDIEVEGLLDQLGTPTLFADGRVMNRANRVFAAIAAGRALGRKEGTEHAARTVGLALRESSMTLPADVLVDVLASRIRADAQERFGGDL
jgi:hypothetical protein